MAGWLAAFSRNRVSSTVAATSEEFNAESGERFSFGISARLSSGLVLRAVRNAGRLGMELDWKEP